MLLVMCLYPFRLESWLKALFGFAGEGRVGAAVFSSASRSQSLHEICKESADEEPSFRSRSSVYFGNHGRERMTFYMQPFPPLSNFREKGKRSRRRRKRRLTRCFDCPLKGDREYLRVSIWDLGMCLYCAYVAVCVALKIT